MAMRYRLVSDGDGHRFACPVELVDAFYQWEEAATRYWEPGSKYEGDPPEMPSGVLEIDGHFTFADPKCDCEG